MSDKLPSSEETPLHDELARALAERTVELEAAQRQILAFRLESTVQLSFVAELQQTTAEALMRAERAEHELRMIRVAQSEIAD